MKSKGALAQAARVYEVLVRECVAGGRNKLTYGDLAEKCGGIARGQAPYLRYLQQECERRGLPTITVFVVDKATGLPGAGCNVSGEVEVARAIAQVRAVKWPPAAEFLR